eukprot:m.138347 g.138347  ORF g.138347 m.138347 type:complete len:429 (+) comp17027_c0_seq5:144-1430(+)
MSFLCPVCHAENVGPPGAPQIKCYNCGTVVAVPPGHGGAPSRPPPPTAHGHRPPAFAPNPYAPPPPPAAAAAAAAAPPPAPVVYASNPYAPAAPAPGAYAPHPPPIGPGYAGPPPHPVAAPPPDGLPLPDPRGLKKALIIGINYRGQRCQLNGCINDARCLEYMLVHKFGWPSANVVTLTDDNMDSRKRPTRRNIISHMQWLASGNPPGTSLWFSFSGHGSQSVDRTGEERDGRNETILPVDHRSAGQIEDNELHDLLVKTCGPGVTLHALVDACHSGTVLDLPWSYDDRSNSWQDEYRHLPVHRQRQKASGGGLVLNFSSCLDDQVSADTSALSHDNAATGAMTFMFIQAVENPSRQPPTYASLLADMKRNLREAGGGSSAAPLDPIGGIMQMLLGGGLHIARRGFKQVPQIAASHAINPTTRPFVL